MLQIIAKTYGERSKNMVVGHVSNDATINIHTRDNRPNVNANYVRFVRSMCTTIQNTATQNTSQSHQNLQDGNHILFFNGFCQYKKNTQKCFFSGILESKRKVGPPPPSLTSRVKKCADFFTQWTLISYWLFWPILNSKL